MLIFMGPVQHTERQKEKSKQLGCILFLNMIFFFFYTINYRHPSYQEYYWYQHHLNIAQFPRYLCPFQYCIILFRTVYTAQNNIKVPHLCQDEIYYFSTWNIHTILKMSSLG